VAQRSKAVAPTVAVGCLALCALLLSSEAVAQPSSFFFGPIPDRAVRVETAKEWLDGFVALDRQVPTLSPAEAAWLKTEYDDQLAGNGGRYTERALEATHSREFNLRRVRTGIAPIIALLRSIIKISPSKLDSEVRDWALLAVEYVQPEFWQSIEDLIERKLVRPELNGVKAGYLENHAMWAGTILDRIVVPYLDGRLR
jgi:hypothetical protein